MREFCLKTCALLDSYRLRFIPDRNRNWLHVGLNPAGSTKNLILWN